MKVPAKADLGAQIAAAIDWWRDAGVDSDFAETPTRWLAADDKPLPPREGADLVRPGGLVEADATAPPTPTVRSTWPQDLAAFTAWWLSEPALDDGRVSGRVPPRGREGAEFMVIVPDPERDDAAREGPRLLSGQQGRLLDAMLAAMEIGADDVYLASVLPRHMPMADWAQAAEKGFGELLRHHVQLVGPKRLVALGSNILPLLGNDPAHSPAVLLQFNQHGVTIPLFAGKSLSALLERPRWKAGLWQGWLDWTERRSMRG